MPCFFAVHFFFINRLLTLVCLVWPTECAVRRPLRVDQAEIKDPPARTRRPQVVLCVVCWPLSTHDTEGPTPPGGGRWGGGGGLGLRGLR